MNKVMLTGWMTKDADVRYTNENEPTAIAHFSLAVNKKSRREGQQNADFIRHVAFGKLAEFMEKYGGKGVKFEIVGRIQTGSYINREGKKTYTFEVVCEEISFAESKGAAQQNKQDDGFLPMEGDEDALPFT